MRKTFDAELLELGQELTDMALQAQTAIDVVTNSLTSRDAEGARQVLDGTAGLDQVERDIENHCLTLLLRQQPVARDLRTISTALKMVTDLQRIGDQAANIAELTLLLVEQHPSGLEVPDHIQQMSQRAGMMVRQAIAAYTARDVAVAHGVINLDDQVDELFTRVKEELIERIVQERDNADQAVDLIIIAKYLERIADHAVNIANWAIFCVTGKLQ